MVKVQRLFAKTNLKVPVCRTYRTITQKCLQLELPTENSVYSHENRNRAGNYAHLTSENGKGAVLTSGCPAFQQHVKRTEGSDSALPPCTFRKYCTQSEKTATSPNCKQITQPSGAATPRNSDAHKRIAVPKAFCVLWEHPRPSPKSGKTCRSDTRPGDVGERAERSESSDTTPIQNTPVSACVPLCAIFL